MSLFLIWSPSSESRRQPKVIPGYRRRRSPGEPEEGGYFIRGGSRFSGELGEHAVEGEQGFESSEKPFTTTDLVPAGALNSDVAIVPLNAERVEDNRVSDRQFIGRNHNFVGVADN